MLACVVLVVRSYIVVVSVVLVYLPALLRYAIDIEVTIILRTILGRRNNYLTTLINIIVANRNVNAFKNLGIKVYSLACNILIARGYIIIRTFKFIYLPAILLYIINVEISICIRSIFRFGNNHSSFSIKLILASGKRIAKLISSIGQIFCLYIGYTISKNLMIASDIIIVTFVLNDLICLLSCSINIEIITIYTCIRNSILSCGSKVINLRCLYIGFRNFLYAYQDIALIINTITITIDIDPHRLPTVTRSIIIRTIIISGSIRSLYPYSREYSTCLRHLINNGSGKLICTSLCSHG